MKVIEAHRIAESSNPLLRGCHAEMKREYVWIIQEALRKQMPRQCIRGRCPNCEAVLDGDYKFCHECGQAIEKGIFK